MLARQHEPLQVQRVAAKRLLPLLLLLACVACAHAFHPYDPLDPTTEKPRPYFVPYDQGFVGTAEAAENPAATLANPGNQFTRTQPNIFAGVHPRRTCECMARGLGAGGAACPWSQVLRCTPAPTHAFRPLRSPQRYALLCYSTLTATTTAAM